MNSTVTGYQKKSKTVIEAGGRPDRYKNQQNTTIQNAKHRITRNRQIKDRQTERQRQTERKTDRQTDRDRQRDRQTDIDRQRDRQTDRQRQTKRQTDRQTDRDRQRDRQTDRETDRQTCPHKIAGVANRYKTNNNDHITKYYLYQLIVRTGLDQIIFIAEGQ